MRSIIHPGTFLIFLAAMLWATDAPFRVALLKDLSPHFVVLAEHFFNVLVVLPLLWMKRSVFLSLTKGEWAALAVIAVGGSAIATFAFTLAFAYVNPSVAILLQKLQPLIAITLASLMLGERRNPGFWLWAAISLTAAYLISFPAGIPRLYEGEQFNPHLIGVGLAALAAFLWAVSTVLGKKLLRRVDFTAVTAMRFCIAFIFLLIFNAFTGHLGEARVASGADWINLCIIALVSGAASLGMYYYGLRTTKASVATLAELGFPLAAMLINALFLGEKLALTQILASLALLFSIWRLGKAHAHDADVHLA